MAISEGYNTQVVFKEDSILTTVTNSADKVSEWINDVELVHQHRLHQLIVGLDVAWRHSYDNQNPVATLHLCVGRRCLVYQILRSRYIPLTLVDFLSRRNYTFVGVRIGKDIRRLHDDYGIGRYAACVDLGRLVANKYGMKSLKNAGLRRLSMIVLGTEFDKPQQVTTGAWDNRCLTEEQVYYAAVEAFVAFEIGRFLNAYHHNRFNSSG